MFKKLSLESSNINKINYICNQTIAVRNIYMKFRKIKFENHPILGTCEFNFTDNKGNTINTIIVAGENGCGKSVLLNELFNFRPDLLYNIKENKIYTEIELNEDELNLIRKKSDFTNIFSSGLGNGIFSIQQDPSMKELLKQCMVTYNNSNYQATTTYGINLSSYDGSPLFKPMLSDVEINFTPEPIQNVTLRNVDLTISGPTKSSNNLATEITQLLIDIDNLDNADLANWVNKHSGEVPPEDVKRIRLKRFTSAFDLMFPNKHFVGIENENGQKKVVFQELGKRMSINELSSGEKQIVFRGSFLLKNQKSTEGALVLIDEPELSLHPRWQMKILNFLRGLFINESGEQTSQLIIATHSPFIIHNVTRMDDKVIVIKKNERGERIISSDPEYYSWSESQIIEEAFNVKPYIDANKINVFLEGETDEQYFNKAFDVYGIDKNLISFKWIGRSLSKGKSENTGSSALNNAALFLKANPMMLISQVYLLYDCDTKKREEDCEKLHIRCMTENVSAKRYKKGIENLLILSEEFNFEDFYVEFENIDAYGAKTIHSVLEKTKLCNYICSLSNEKLGNIFINIKLEIDKIMNK